MELHFKLTLSLFSEQMSYFGVLREDIVHQSFVPWPQWTTAAAHSYNTHTENTLLLTLLAVGLAVRGSRLL